MICPDPITVAPGFRPSILCLQPDLHLSNRLSLDHLSVCRTEKRCDLTFWLLGAFSTAWPSCRRVDNNKARLSLVMDVYLSTLLV